MESWCVRAGSWLGALSLASVSSMALGTPLEADTREVHAFNVSGADPTNAIHSLGKQAGIEIVASAEDLRNKKLNSVSGTISTSDALSSLLAGTGLEYRYVGDRAVALLADAASDQASPRQAGGAPPASQSVQGRGEARGEAQEASVSKEKSAAASQPEPDKPEEVVVTGVAPHQRLQGADPGDGPEL